MAERQDTLMKGAAFLSPCLRQCNGCLSLKASRERMSHTRAPSARRWARGGSRPRQGPAAVRLVPGLAGARNPWLRGAVFHVRAAPRDRPRVPQPRRLLHRAVDHAVLHAPPRGDFNLPPRRQQERHRLHSELHARLRHHRELRPAPCQLPLRLLALPVSPEFPSQRRHSSPVPNQTTRSPRSRCASPTARVSPARAPTRPPPTSSPSPPAPSAGATSPPPSSPARPPASSTPRRPRTSPPPPAAASSPAAAAGPPPRSAPTAARSASTIPSSAACRRESTGAHPLRRSPSPPPAACAASPRPHRPPYPRVSPACLRVSPPGSSSSPSSSTSPGSSSTNAPRRALPPSLLPPGKAFRPARHAHAHTRLHARALLLPPPEHRGAPDRRVERHRGGLHPPRRRPRHGHGATLPPGPPLPPTPPTPTHPTLPTPTLPAPTHTYPPARHPDPRGGGGLLCTLRRGGQRGSGARLRGLRSRAARAQAGAAGQGGGRGEAGFARRGLLQPLGQARGRPPSPPAPRFLPRRRPPTPDAPLLRPHPRRLLLFLFAGSLSAAGALKSADREIERLTAECAELEKLPLTPTARSRGRISADTSHLSPRTPLRTSLQLHGPRNLRPN